MGKGLKDSRTNAATTPRQLLLIKWAPRTRKHGQHTKRVLANTHIEAHTTTSRQYVRCRPFLSRAKNFFTQHNFFSPRSLFFYLRPRRLWHVRNVTLVRRGGGLEYKRVRGNARGKREKRLPAKQPQDKTLSKDKRPIKLTVNNSGNSQMNANEAYTFQLHCECIHIAVGNSSPSCLRMHSLIGVLGTPNINGKSTRQIYMHCNFCAYLLIL